MLQNFLEIWGPFCLTEDKNVCKYVDGLTFLFSWRHDPKLITILNLIKNL